MRQSGRSTSSPGKKYSSTSGMLMELSRSSTGVYFFCTNSNSSFLNRPLLNGEHEYGSLTRKRRNSQPNLNQDLLESKSGVPGHIAGTGNINMEQQRITTVEQEKMCVQTKEWRSSGSIFDCEQGCFSDNTVVI